MPLRSIMLPSEARRPDLGAEPKRFGGERKRRRTAHEGSERALCQTGIDTNRARRSSSRAYPDRDRYREGARRIGRGSARTSRRSGRDRALRIGRRVPSRPGEDASPARDPRRSRRRPLGALFRREAYAQGAIPAASGRTLRQAGVGRGRVGQAGEAPPAQHEAPPVGRGGAFRSAGGVLPGGPTRRAISESAKAVRVRGGF